MQKNNATSFNGRESGDLKSDPTLIFTNNKTLSSESLQSLHHFTNTDWLQAICIERTRYEI